jgi:Subtilase family
MNNDRSDEQGPATLSGWPPQGPIYFRPAEISLLLRAPAVPAEKLLPDLRGLLRNVDIELHASPLKRPAQRRDRECIRLPRPDDDLCLLTLNLDGWTEGLTGDSKHPQRLRQLLIATGRAVRILADLSQRHYRAGMVQIVAAAPNWLTMPFDWCGCAAPAAPPHRPGTKPFPPTFKPENPPRFRPTRREQADEGLVLSEALHKLTGTNPQGDGVDIAIFDTWPLDSRYPGPLGVIQHRLEQITAQLSGVLDPADVTARTRLLAAAASGEIVPKEFIYDFVEAYSSIEDLDLLRRIPPKAAEASYAKADHGLFIADIIKDIAPRAQLSVYRVLNDRGIGETDTLALAIAHALGNRCPGRRLLLNFSGGLAPQLAVLRTLLESPELPYDDPATWMAAIAASPGDAATVLRRLEAAGVWGKGNPLSFTGALATVNWLFSGRNMPGDVLVVASAGNDSGDREPLPPRLPAAVPGVLGVSAVLNDGTLASYSNRNDIPLLTEADGTAAYGGSLPGAVSEDGPIALYVSEFLPPNTNQVNDVGLALWSGTSFATAIASGFAACIWSSDLSAFAQAIVQNVTPWQGSLSMVRQQA